MYFSAAFEMPKIVFGVKLFIFVELVAICS